MGRRLSNAIGLDDAPFPRSHRGDVPVVGTVYAGLRLQGVLVGKVRRDGANATRALTRLIGGSRFAAQLHVVLLQGIALAGFNVVDIHALARALDVAVLVVARRRPRLSMIREALARVPGGARKWRLIEKAGPMERAGNVWVQRAALSLEEATALVEGLRVQGNLPEPIRAAHLIAGALALGHSHGRA